MGIFGKVKYESGRWSSFFFFFLFLFCSDRKELDNKGDRDWENQKKKTIFFADFFTVGFHFFGLFYGFQEIFETF